MSAAGAPRRLVRSDELVSPLELFFDLVFVFALTQVTAFLADPASFSGLLQGLLMLTLMWWAWSGYAWLTSTVDPEHTLPRIVMFAAMAAFLIVALATPHAFDDRGVVWGVAYLVVRLLHAALFAVAARGDRALARQVTSLVLSAIPGAGLIIAASAVAEPGTTRDLLWLAAVVVDYGIVLAFGVEGWHVHAKHFAERFGLVLIIAFGESIVATGVGAGKIDGSDVVAATVGIVVVCMLWWAYFDVYALVAERRFSDAVGVEQLRIARDSYALLHLPMIAGIVLFALGMKKTLGHAGDPLKDMPAVALCGGVALYAFAHVAFRLRNTGTVEWSRLVAAFASLAVLPLALEVSALSAVAALAAIWVGLIGYETVRFREFRAKIRSAH